MTWFLPILAAVTLAGAVAAMTLRNLVHCALALTVAFAGLAALYLSLGAQFAGLAQLLVYVGAVAILIVFAILLTPPAPGAGDGAKPARPSSAIVGVILSLAVFMVVAWAVMHSSVRPAPTGAPQPAIQQIGAALLDNYVLPLEAIGLMLTAALIGAVTLAMKETRPPR